MEQNEIKTGLWEKTSKKGLTYYAGKLKINDTEYRVTLFTGTKKNEKSPDYTIILEEPNNHKNENKQEIKTADPYSEFAEEISEDDFPF